MDRENCCQNRLNFADGLAHHIFEVLFPRHHVEPVAGIHSEQQVRRQVVDPNRDAILSRSASLYRINRLPQGLSASAARWSGELCATWELGHQGHQSFTSWFAENPFAVSSYNKAWSAAAIACASVSAAALPLKTRIVSPTSAACLGFRPGTSMFGSYACAVAMASHLRPRVSRSEG